MIKINRNLIWFIVIFVGLLISGFFIFNYLMPKDSSVSPASHSESEQSEGEESHNDLSKQIGQMLIIGFRGAEVNDNSYIAKVIEELKIGGVVLFDKDVPSKGELFPRNIQSPEQVKKLIAGTQSFSEIPLFISVDAEGGQINRLKQEYGFIAMPSHKALGQGDFGNTEIQAEKLGRQLKELGFNMDFAPVVDLNINPENPIIGALDRAFSDDPLQVTWHAKAFIDGLRKQGIIAVVKHFPGHGSSVGDSHKGLVDVTETYQEAELFPYFLLQEEEAMDAVMTAHIVHRNIDGEYPSTLSPFFINDTLRSQIGFNGVVISDDMQMKAITENYGLEEAIILAINAGCDIILLSNNSTEEYDERLPYRAYEIIEKAVADGRISQERIAEALSRIDNLKKQFNIIKVAE